MPCLPSWGTDEMRWRDIASDPPPIERLVWVTDWRTFVLAKRIPVSRGKKTECLWHYRGPMVPLAVSWCERSDFEGVVIPERREVRI